MRHFFGKLDRWVLLASCLLTAPLWAEVPDPITFGYAVERGDLRKVRGWLDEGLSPEYQAAHIGTGLMVAAWYGDKLPSDKKSAIDGALAELKTAHGAKDLTRIDAAMEKLNAAWQAASQDMYNAQQQAGNPQGDAGAGANASSDAEVTDVDFEEVKDDKK